MGEKKRLKDFLGDTLYGNRATFIIRILLGGLFILSGSLKLFEPDTFARIIALYDILPDAFAAYAAILVPVLEVLLGLLLLMGYKLRAAALLLMVLVALFIVFITVNLVRGRSFDCGCFDTRRFGLNINETISPWLVIRNLIILAGLALVFRAEKHLASIEWYWEKKRLKNLEKTKYE